MLTHFVMVFLKLKDVAKNKDFEQKKLQNYS